jgi:hypothetical protein
MQHEIKNMEKMGEDLPFLGLLSSLLDLMVLSHGLSVKQGQQASFFRTYFYKRGTFRTYFLNTKLSFFFGPFRINKDNSGLRLIPA